MTRLGLLMLVGALAVTATKVYDESNRYETSSHIRETAFRPGVEYTYKYDSQVLTGIPNGGNQYAGLKIKCTVRIHLKSSSLVLMKLEEIKICEVNHDIHTSLPSEMLSEEFCTPTPSEHVRVMITELRKPLSFKYENGLVSRLETETSDPFWSVNIKRGILNLFQLSLNQEREVTDLSHETFEATSDYTMRNVIRKDRSVDKLFKVKEHDVVGDCETVYAIYGKEPSTSSFSSDSFQVTKVKDYKRCTNKVIYEQGLFAGHTSWLWMSHSERKPLITPVTHVTYEMTGTRSHFLIRKAKLHSEYIFTPYSEEGGSMVTYIKQHLELIGAESTRTPIALGSNSIVHNHALLLHVPHALAKLRKEGGSFNRESELNTYKWERETPYNRESRETRYNKESRETSEETSEETSFESNKKWGKRTSWMEEEGEESLDEATFSKWDSSYKKFDWTRDFTTMTSTSNVDKVRIMIKDILSSMTPYISEETPSKLIILKRVLETCTSDELWTIVNDVCSTIGHSEPEHKRAREIVLDLLPALPKSVVPHIIRSLVSKNIIFPKRGAYMISLYSLMAPASPKIVKSMLTVCKESIMRSDEQLKRTCLLGLGTVTHKLYGMHLKTKVPKTFGVIEEVVEELKTRLTTTTNPETKMLILCVIGNTGLPEFIPELHRVVRDKTALHVIRRVAIYAMRRMAILAPTEVNKIALPVFMDSNEKSDIRIVSFLTCLHTKPRTSTILLMVNRLRNDPSMNLKSFIYSYLSSLAKTVGPSEHHLAKSAKLAMLTMKPYDFGFSYSKGYNFAVKSEKMNMGAMLEHFLTHTSTSSLPNGYYIKLGSIFANRPFHLFETGAEIRGMDEVINTIYHRTRPMWSKLSTFDWSRAMTPEWYREIYPEVSTWFSANKWNLREWFKTYETPEGEKINWGSLESTVRDILSKIKFEDRSFEMPELLSYFMILGNQISYSRIDHKFISEIISNTEWMSTIMSHNWRSSIPVNMMNTLPLIDNCFVIPTPIGMPLHINFTALAVTKMTGTVTPISLPSIRDLFSRSLPEEIKVAVDVKPSFAIKMMCEMGVHFNVMKATTVVKGHVIGHAPIKSEVSFNLNEKKFKLNWEIPQESFTPMKVGMKVNTRIFRMPLRHYNLITSDLIFDKDVVHPTVLKSIPFSMSPITTAFGMNIAVTSEMHTRRATWAPLFPLCGRFNFHFTCSPSEERPRLAEFKAIFGSSHQSEFYSSKSSAQRSDSSLSDEWDILSPVFPTRRDHITSIRNEVESDISEITPFSDITNPRSRHVTLLARTIGGKNPRYIQTHITWIHSKDYLLHQLNYQTTGTPMLSSYPLPIKVMFDTVLNLKTLFTPYTTADNLVAKVDFFYGDKSYTKSDFSLKVMSGRTGMSWESDYSPLNRYPAITSASGEKYEYYCTFMYNRLPTVVEDKFVQGYEMLKVLLYPYLYIKKTGLTSEQNKVTAYIKIVPKHNKITAVINTPTELDVIVDVPTFNPLFSRETVSLSVPAPVLMTEGFEPSSAFEPEEFESTKTSRWSWFKSWTGQCTVTDSMVKTFDDVTYTMPEMPSSCEMILARDCSSMSMWMVTMSPMSTMTPSMTHMKMVRMMVPHYEFKVMPSSMSYGGMTFFVNGMQKDITPGQPMMLPDTTMPSGDMAYTISMEGDMIKIECMKMGMMVMTNGKYIMIQSMSMYRGRMCGMCGNFDGKSTSEYEGPMKMIYERPEHFVVKYTIPNSECSVSDLVSKHNVPDYTFSGECVHEMRNVAKVIFRHGEKKICFSIKPEPVCGETCKRINPRPKYVSFHCLPANDVTTQTLFRESRKRVLSELAWKPIDLHDYIDTQDKCISA